MNQVTFGTIAGDGSGQTIAIIGAFDYPTALIDVQAFSTQFGLPLFNQPGGPTFTRVAQDGSQNYPGTDPAGAGNAKGTWEGEAALDIQWAHAMAPGANIIYVEASNTSVYPNYPLIQSAANWARQQPGVSVISMSFSNAEFFTDVANNQYLTTPQGHQGITFVASTGDTGAPGGFPASSPNVVAVGGTSLVLTNGQYSETGWGNSYGSSGGGISTNQSKPWYQAGVTQSAAQRTSPDIALDGDPNTGVAIYDSWDYPGSPWVTFGGTSLAAPLFAGMVAVANQGRALFGLGTLDGFSQTLPALYSAPAADFHDITSGNNGTYSAGPGYDLVTGRGSPIANLLVPHLVGVVGSITGTTYQDNNANSTKDAGDTLLAGVRLYIDANNNGAYDIGGTQTQSTGPINVTIPDNNPSGAFSQLSVGGLNGAISDINLTLSIIHPSDNQLTAYLIAPDGTQITLFSRIGGTSANFSNTTFDDQAASSITSGIAPFAGTFTPSWLLQAFNGKTANGTWKLKIVDGTSAAVGTLASWSLTITTATEISALSASDGTYSLGPLAAGSQTVREILPSGYQPSGPLSQTFNLTGNVTGANFGQILTTFTTTPSSNSFYLWVNQGMTAIGNSPTTPLVLLPAGQATTFNLTTPGSTLIVDFINGSPLALGNVTVNGGGIADSQIRLLGAATTLTLTDFQIAPSSGGLLHYANLGILDLLNSSVTYSGNLGTLQNLIVDSGTLFYWV